MAHRLTAAHLGVSRRGRARQRALPKWSRRCQSRIRLPNANDCV